MIESLVKPRAGLRVPLHRPFLAGKEPHYVGRAATRIGSDGEYTRGCARLLESRFGINRVLMTPSCTAALELAVLLCGVGPGDEVILPSYTFVSTANAVVRAGGRPVFVNVRPDTLNIDASLIESAITSKTRAVIPVHYAGVGCPMGEIMELAGRYGIKVIEDAAQGVNASVGGRALGSIGDLGAYSFHETKNFTCGEGGALCVNNPDLIERAEVLRDKGTNRARFFRGEVERYTWVDVGSSYLPAELSCAFLLAQLEAMDAITLLRREVDRLYREGLSSLEAEGRARLPFAPEGVVTNYHNFYLILESPEAREDLMDHLRRAGIAAAFHFVPLHTSPMGRTLGYREGELPVTEDLSRRLLRLPFYTGMDEETVDQVVANVLNFFGGVKSGGRHTEEIR